MKNIGVSLQKCAKMLFPVPTLNIFIHLTQVLFIMLNIPLELALPIGNKSWKSQCIYVQIGKALSLFSLLKCALRLTVIIITLSYA